MGDHRASIKIEVQFHGVKKKTEMDINWVEEIPSSVADFFEEAYREGLAVYHDKMADYYAERKKQEELTELKRLQAKYGGVPPNTKERE